MNAQTLPRQVESQTQARFNDCDPFNHLNNSRYIDYIINAREDQLIQFYNFDVHKMAKETGLTWVVAQTQIAYLIPVAVMEVITIETRMLGFTPKGLLIEAIMWNKGKTKVKAVMWSKQAHYNLKERRIHEHSAELLELFNNMYLPLPGNPTFEQRADELRRLNVAH
jgi:acyl-CoA thioester hydrolase